MMLNSIFRACVVLVVAGAFLLSVSVAAAAGMWVSPNSGDYDTVYTVHAGGFVPGEHVDTWVNKPGQWRVGQGDYVADASGAIEFEFRPDVTWGTGGFFASAIGLASGREYTASFSIGGGGLSVGAVQLSFRFVGQSGRYGGQL